MTYPYYGPYWQIPSYLSALQQNYANQMQQQQQQNTQAPVRVIPISNDAEVNTIPADHNGNPTFFYNKSGNKIFIKQVNPQTMEATIQAFKGETPPKDEAKNAEYQTIMQSLAAIYKDLDAIKNGSITTQPPILNEPITKGKKQEQ